MKTARFAATAFWLWAACLLLVVSEAAAQFVLPHDTIPDFAGSPTVNIQINNGTIDSTSYTSGSYDSGGSFKIGSAPDFSEHFDGLIDQVGFWKRVLTAQERSDLYNSGNGLSYAALTGGGASNKVPILMMRQRLMGARK